jgi:hypothetical protein
MATDDVSSLANEFRQLTPTEQIRLFDELRHIVSARASNGMHSVLELRGLGSELWSSVDAQEYVRRERTAWNG